MDKEMIIAHLGILVTTYCNLNCRNCADLIPKRRRQHYEFLDIKNDLLRILEVADFIEEVLIIGGEALLYTDLRQVVEFCGNHPKIGKIIITTNGTIMPDEQLLSCLKQHKVVMRISGYPDYVAPDRESIVRTFMGSVEVENLENMVWMSMGDEHDRGRTIEELEQVFRTCSMKDCVTINAEGKIFYCSRQLSAHEISMYPDPEEHEYIDVRNTKNLREDLERFYKLSYISTCNFCDGISCVTSHTVPTATQILDKAAFLECIQIYTLLEEGNNSAAKQLEVIKRMCSLLKTYIKTLIDFYETEEIIEIVDSISCNNLSMIHVLTDKWKNLLNALTKDYNFSISKNVPYGMGMDEKNMPNCIHIGFYPLDKDADILLTDSDIRKAVNEKYPIDGIAYNRLFIQSKFQKLLTEKIPCIVCGLSYTQYGILEEQMPIPTVNLSVTGEDVPYSVLMAEYALKLNADIEWIIFPITYYQCCYDMSADEHWLHKEVVTRINIPLLNDPRNFKEMIRNDVLYHEGVPLQIYEAALNLKEACDIRDESVKNYLMDMEYFNDMNPPSPFGGAMKFNFRELSSDKERLESAKITAEHNERICTADGYQEVMKYLKTFLEMTKNTGKKVFIFIPPMTDYLYRSYHDELKDFYYNNFLPVVQSYQHIIFYDFTIDSHFEDADFRDFEHLNEEGAKKMTEIISKVILQNIK